MKIILFYILRKFFVNLEIKRASIVLETRFIIRKRSEILRRDIVRVQIRRTPVLRLLGAEEITVFTQGAKFMFFLSENESLDLNKLIKIPARTALKPRFFERLFGAFIDTRALAGILLFVFTLRKIGKIFGGNYLDSVIRAIFTTAESLSRALEIAHIVLPRTAVFLAVFALAAWLFSFIEKAVSLSRFELRADNSAIFVKSGLITLYENLLVRNTAAVVARTTLFSMITKRSPLYYRGVLVFPCADKSACRRILRAFFKIEMPRAPAVRSPRRAVFGHCAIPLWLFLGFSAALFALLLSGNGSALIIRTTLTAGIIISAYLFLLFFLYMERSVFSFSEDVCVISSRKSTALYTAFFPSSLVVGEVRMCGIFQRMSGLCSLKLLLIEKRRFTARLMPIKSASLSDG